jgi:hypothetical protein
MTQRRSDKLVIVCAGALWQFVGTRLSSPTPFLAARLVDRGGDAPLRSAALLQQPERGSFLQAGGTKPTGFWSGSVSWACNCAVDRAMDGGEEGREQCAAFGACCSSMWQRSCSDVIRKAMCHQTLSCDSPLSWFSDVYMCLSAGCAGWRQGVCS